MGIKERIQQDMKAALRVGDKERLSALRMVMAAIKNKEIELKKADPGLTDEEVWGVLLSEIKKRRDAAEQYARGGRDDLARKEEEEIAVLQQYLPEQMDEGELRALAREVITAVGAGGVKDMGKVMKELMPKVAGRAEGKVVSRVVKEELSKS